MHVLFVNYVSYSVVFFFFCSFFRKSRAFSAVYSAHRYEHYIIILALRNRAPRTATQQLIWVRFPPVMILHNAPKTTLDEFCLMKPNERARNACFHVKKKKHSFTQREPSFTEINVYIYIYSHADNVCYSLSFSFLIWAGGFFPITLYIIVCVWNNDFRRLYIILLYYFYLHYKI